MDAQASESSYIARLEAGETLVGAVQPVEHDLPDGIATVAARENGTVVILADPKIMSAEQLVALTRASFLMDGDLYAGRNASIIRWDQLTDEAWQTASI